MSRLLQWLVRVVAPVHRTGCFAYHFRTSFVVRSRVPGGNDYGPARTSDTDDAVRRHSWAAISVFCVTAPVGVY